MFDSERLKYNLIHKFVIISPFFDKIYLLSQKEFLHRKSEKYNFLSNGYKFCMFNAILKFFYENDCKIYHFLFLFKFRINESHVVLKSNNASLN